MESGVVAVDDFDSLVVCGRLALGGLAVTCPENHVSLLVGACVTEVESSKATDVIGDLVVKV